MAIVEDVTEGEDVDRSSEEVLKTVQDLAARLILQEDLLADSDSTDAGRYIEKAILILHQIAEHVAVPSWAESTPERQAQAIQNVLRLYGEDSWTSSGIRDFLDAQIAPHLSPDVPLEILRSLRGYFTPHPSLSSSTSRALSRPSGGPDPTQDMHDSQPFKSPQAWGVANLLCWAVTNMTETDVEKHVGLILPPTLVMMDDFAPPWRATGAWCLDAWMGKLDPALMRRMGMDKLLLKSLVHTLSLHANPPLRGVLDITLRVVQRVTEKGSEERSRVYVEIMERSVVQGWTYAPSGLEGRAVLVDIARNVEIMCDVLGPGIARWLKTIIPSLLGPLQYPPTPPVLQHFQANLSSLLCMIRKLTPTGRIGRWRGQIINVLSRLAVQLRERQSIDLEHQADNRLETKIHSLVKDIYAELALDTPSVISDEYPRLLALAPNIFSDLLPTTPA